MRREVYISKGTVSVHTLPVMRQNDAYRTLCQDYSVSVFIKPPNGLEQYFQRALAGRHDSSRRVYTPCVIDKRVHAELSHHRAWLLIPPDIDRSSEFFARGLVVPDLRVRQPILREGRLVGYVLVSDYLGTQQFFVPPNAHIHDLGDTRYQGRVSEIPVDSLKRPVIKITLSSEGHEGVFEENAERLAEISATSSGFWWNTDLSPKPDYSDLW